MSSGPKQRLGVYKTLDDVPQRSLLEDKAGALPHDDPWECYIDSKQEHGERTQARYARIGRIWPEHMEEQRRHYALPDPEHVESFFQLYSENKLDTLYDCYYVQLNGFFKWMMYHVDYP